MVLFECYRERKQIEFADFLQMLEGVELAYLCNNDEVMGVVTRKNGEIHCGILPKWRGKWASKHLVNAGLRWAAKSGKLTTSIAKDNLRGMRFVEKLGFERIDNESFCYQKAI